MCTECGQVEFPYFFYCQVTYHLSVPLDPPALEAGHVFVNRFPLPPASK